MDRLLNINFSIGGDNIYSLPGQILIVGDPIRDKKYSYPFRTDSICAMVVKSGKMSCRIDMHNIEVDQGGLLIILESQIVENLSFASDFSGECIIFSSAFMRNLSISDTLKPLLRIKNHPFTPLDEACSNAISDYIKMMRDVIRQEDHPHREEICRLLTKSFYLTISYYLRDNTFLQNTNRTSDISSQFISLIQDNCARHRDLAYYADKLNISIKYLSSVVKSTTGKSPSKWIEDYTILKAKQMLSAPGITVSQVSYSLGFASQSDFGKYFKKITGMTPKSFQCSSR